MFSTVQMVHTKTQHQDVAIRAGSSVERVYILATAQSAMTLLIIMCPSLAHAIALEPLQKSSSLTTAHALKSRYRQPAQEDLTTLYQTALATIVVL